MSAGWFYLAAMIGMYGLANLLQSVAASRTYCKDTLDPKLLVRLMRQGVYVTGVVLQTAGFVLAFLARRDLPLFLVQSTVAAGLGVTTVLGVLVLRWRLPKTEILLLLALCAGLAGLVVSAQPHPSRQLGPAGVAGLVIALGVVSVGGFFAARLRGVPGSVGLGALAGIAFGAAAVASRPLANIHVDRYITNPLLYLVIAHSVVGQLLLGLAMQRGSTTAAVAAMDAAAAVPAAFIGLLFLGDEITQNLEWVAAAGFLVTLGAVIGLTFFAEPQHHHQQQLAGHQQLAGRHRVPEPSIPGVHTRAQRAAAMRRSWLAADASAAIPAVAAKQRAD